MSKIKNLFYILFSIGFLTTHSLALEGEKVKIGVIIPLSGVLAEYGVATKNGIEMAIENYPSEFEHIEFIFEDSKWEPKVAITVFQHLVNNRKVDMVYSWGNPVNEAIAPLAERARIPTLVMTSDLNTTKGKKYVIQAINASDSLSDPLEEYLKESNFKNIGIIMAENTYVQGLLEGIREALDPNQRIEVISRHEISETDFRSTITKLRNKKYDALGVFLISGQLNKFYNQMAVQKVSLPSFGSDFLESETEIKMAKGNLEGVVYPNIAVAADFHRQYQRKHKQDLQISFAGHSHDIALYMAKASSQERRVEEKSMSLIERLRNQQPLSGVCGTSEYREREEGGAQIAFPVYLKKIVNNRIIQVD